jgi:membrane-bound lytic murein transglycosylase D
MRTFWLLALLSSPAALAAPDETVPALDPPEGSLWDHIEELEGAVPQSSEVIEASEELEEARAMEASFIDLVVQEMAPPLSFYRDPVSALNVDPLHLDRVRPSEFDIPIEINEDVIRWMKYFTGNGRRHYARYLARSTIYRPMMYEKLDAAGLPRDLVYLSMIESGYATHAYSSAAAVGLWQFIAPTGKQYNLRIDWWVDERRDPAMATDAAIGFLGDLHKRFGHWYLAWAAYNGGPGRVSRAISSHGTKDFWTLVDRNGFASETDNYVPKIIAAAIIGKHPERYGFTDISYQEERTYDTVKVGPNVGLEVLARCAGISTEELQGLNPHLRRWALPPSPEEQILYVPKNTGTRFLAALADVPEQERLTYQRHRVQSGESLSAIATRYGVSTEAVQSVNRISNPNRITVGMELVIPTSGSTASQTALASTAPTPAASRSTAPAPAPTPARSTQTTTHTVQRGEALSKIAEQYGVRTADVMRWNNISNANRVDAGQKLKIHTSAGQWTVHTVRRGDTLSQIAARNSVSTADLRSWNEMSSSTIYVGQKIKIKR